MTDKKESKTSTPSEIIIYGNPRSIVTRHVNMSLDEIKVFSTYIDFATTYFKNHPEESSIKCEQTGNYTAVKRIHEEEELTKDGTKQRVKYVLIDWNY